MHESCLKLIEEYVIPNTTERMENQEFREEALWTLEVDDLIKANLPGIQSLYKKFATNGRHKLKVLKKDDVLALLAAAGDRATSLDEMHGLSVQMNTPANQTMVVYAYSLSKMSIADEMKDFEDYNQMYKAEFYEFLARWAHMLYQFEDITSLVDKISKLLALLLPLVGSEFMPVELEKDIPSDSDYDDDIVENAINSL